MESWNEKIMSIRQDLGAGVKTVRATFAGELDAELNKGFARLHALAEEMGRLEKKLADAVKSRDEALKRQNELESLVAARDKTIGDLRAQRKRLLANGKVRSNIEAHRAQVLKQLEDIDADLEAAPEEP